MNRLHFTTISTSGFRLAGCRPGSERGRIGEQSNNQSSTATNFGQPQLRGALAGLSRL
jgi:hypothetical protein